MTRAAPMLLQAADHLTAFKRSESSLERWLKQRAAKNHESGASRVFVVTREEAVVGYYALSSGSVARNAVTGRVRRNMPEPIPIAVLGRLAVDSGHEGKGLGAGMLRDAVLRTRRAADEIAIQALLCHAIDERAMSFYLHNGFVRSPVEPLTAMMPLV